MFIIKASLQEALKSLVLHYSHETAQINARPDHMTWPLMHAFQHATHCKETNGRDILPQ